MAPYYALICVLMPEVPMRQPKFKVGEVVKFIGQTCELEGVNRITAKIIEAYYDADVSTVVYSLVDLSTGEISRNNYEYMISYE